MTSTPIPQGGGKKIYWLEQQATITTNAQMGSSGIYTKAENIDIPQSILNKTLVGALITICFDMTWGGHYSWATVGRLKTSDNKTTICVFSHKNNDEIRVHFRWLYTD